jgi:trans-aconitate methyltransferase
MSKANPYEGMTREELLAAMPPWKDDVERIRSLGLECPKTAIEAEALLKRFPKAEVGGMSLDRQRKVLGEAERHLIEQERRWAEARKANQQGWIKELRAIGEYHASQKHIHMAAEYWAKQRERPGEYSPVRLFQNEIEDEIRSGR